MSAPIMQGKASWSIASPMAQIQELEKSIRTDLEPIELPVKHHFIPAGTVLVGKVHLFDNLNVVLRGRIAIYTEAGLREFEAGDVIVSPAGVKRAGYAIEDTVWMTVHGTDETNVDLIEQQFVANSYEEYLAFCESLKLKGN
jgi:quercetin dioxygenase-like cupin family protein